MQKKKELWQNSSDHVSLRSSTPFCICIKCLFHRPWLIICVVDYPFSKRQILDSSEMKEFADDSFRFDENGRKFFKWVETLREKEKLLVTSNFSFSHSVFITLVLQTRKNQGLFGKRLKNRKRILLFSKVFFSITRNRESLIYTVGNRNLTIYKDYQSCFCGIVRDNATMSSIPYFEKSCTKPKEVDHINLIFCMTNKCFDSTQIYK